MRHHLSRYTVALAAGYALLMATACEKRERTAALPATTDTTLTGAVTPSVAPSDTASATSMKLTDANIIALLDEANEADSAAGAHALKKATHADVKHFAKLMMSEHHALRVQGKQLAKKLGIKPEAPDNDPVKDLRDKEKAALDSAGSGAAFDRAYINQEVTVHQAVIQLAEQAHNDTQTPQLKTLITQAKPVLEKHLKEAQRLQKELGGS